MRSRAPALIALVLALVALPAFSQTERSGNADARVMQQLQQITAERAALQTENAVLKEEAEKLRKELQQASAGRTALENRNKTLAANASREELSGKQAEEQLEKTRGQLQDLVTKFRETAQTLRDVEIERTTARNQLAVREREFKTCVDRNAGLYNLNAEVLDRMENRGFWSSLAEREPFTKLKRVELENLIDEYRYRADELRIEQQQASAAEQEK